MSWAEEWLFWRVYGIWYMYVYMYMNTTLSLELSYIPPILYVVSQSERDEHDELRVILCPLRNWQLLASVSYVDHSSNWSWDSEDLHENHRFIFFLGVWFWGCNLKVPFFSRMLPRFDPCPSIKETMSSQMLTILFSLTSMYNNDSHNLFLLTTFAQASFVLPCVKLFFFSANLAS